MTKLVHATTSSAFSMFVGGNTITQTWLDGNGKVIQYSAKTPRGRYLASLIARKGFAKKVS